jgi:putative alpha-1,2-mannosidase
MRPKDRDHKWMEDFDPAAYTRKYTQGNAWQYTTFVPQDIPRLVEMMGGDMQFE